MSGPPFDFLKDAHLHWRQKVSRCVILGDNSLVVPGETASKFWQESTSIIWSWAPCAGFVDLAKIAAGIFGVPLELQYMTGGSLRLWWRLLGIRFTNLGQILALAMRASWSPLSATCGRLLSRMQHGLCFNCSGGALFICCGSASL